MVVNHGSNLYPRWFRKQSAQLIVSVLPQIDNYIVLIAFVERLSRKKRGLVVAITAAALLLPLPALD